METKLGWIHFWGQCLKWAFWRWNTVGAVLISVMAIIFGIVGIVGIGGFVAVQEEHAWWLFLMLPVALMTLLVAPHHVWKRQVMRADALVGIKTREDHIGGAQDYADNVIRPFMPLVTRMYKSYHKEHPTDGPEDFREVLRSSDPHGSETESPLLKAFAAAIYRADLTSNDIQDLWRCSGDAGLELRFEEFEKFDRLRSEATSQLRKWAREQRNAPALKSSLYDELYEGGHRGIAVLLTYLDAARAAVDRNPPKTHPELLEFVAGWPRQNTPPT